MMDKLSSFILGIDYDADDAEEKEEVMINAFKEKYIGDSIFAEELSIPPCNGYPEYILEIFLANMIGKNFDATIQCLVAGWNQETFKLELRPACKTWRLFSGLYIPVDLHDYMLCNLEDFYCKGIECVVIKLLRHVVRALNSKDGSGTSIRCLDLSDLLLYDKSAAMLSIINEECRSNVCSKCDQPHSPKIPRGEDCCCESCNRLTIKLNLCLRQNVVTKLVSTLAAVRDGELFVDLIVTGWAIVLRRDYEMMDVCLNSLKELDPENVLTCRFGDDDILYGLLAELPNLKRLDLTDYNTQVWEMDLAASHREKLLTFLIEALKNVHYLEGLYFYDQLLTDNLQSLLGGVGSNSLQHLQISNCSLSKADLTFLGQSAFAESLRNLNISYQALDIDGLQALFAGCKNLTVLDMEESCLEPEDADIDDLFRYLTSLQNLKFLNMGDFQDIDSDVVLSKVNYIGQMPNLKCIRMAYQGSGLEKEECDSAQVAFQDKLKAALEETGNDNPPSISIMFTYIERYVCTGC